MAVESRFILECLVGPRTLESARELLAGVAVCCRPGEPLLLEADDHRPYPQAMLDLFGVTRFRRRKRGRGRRKHPDSKPAPGLMIGIVRKPRDERGHLLGIKPKRLCGRLRDIHQHLEQHRAGCQINTSHIERLNGTCRTQQARLTRRTRTGTVEVDLLRASLWLWRDLYGWTRRHASLGQRTPAMAIGLATSVWTTRAYVQRPVHTSPAQQLLRQERQQQLLTTGLYEQKHRKVLPIS